MWLLGFWGGLFHAMCPRFGAQPCRMLCASWGWDWARGDQSCLQQGEPFPSHPSCSARALNPPLGSGQHEINLYIHLQPPDLYKLHRIVHSKPGCWCWVSSQGRQGLYWDGSRLLARIHPSQILFCMGPCGWQSPGWGGKAPLCSLLDQWAGKEQARFIRVISGC